MKLVQVKNDIRQERLESVRSFWSWVDFFVVVIGILLIFTILKNCIFMCVQVSGSSMYPTLKTDDYLVMDRTSPVGRGDVVIVYSDKLDKLLVKRVLGLPGDTLYTENGDLYRIEAGSDVAYLVEEDYLNNQHSTWAKATFFGTEDMVKTYVEDGTVFVMGDNRTVSMDSRSKSVGPIRTENILGVIHEYIIDYKDSLQFLYRLF